VKLDSDSEAYCTAVMDHAAMKQWIADARNEPWLISAYELG
jgi:glutathione S-transferase